MRLEKLETLRFRGKGNFAAELRRRFQVNCHRMTSDSDDFSCIADVGKRDFYFFQVI